MADERLLPHAWEHADTGTVRLVATRCGRCDALTFPPVPACPSCWERVDLRAEPLPPIGTVYAFSVVRVADPELEPPYAVGYVDFPGGVRVGGRFVDDPDLAVGDRVAVESGVVRRRPEGPLRGWMFRRIAA